MYATRSDDEQRAAADAKLAELRRQIADEERAQRDREAQARRELAGIQKAAGASHTRVVLELYELLGVEVEHPRSRVIGSGEKQRTVAVSTDKDESMRVQRLHDLVEQLVQAVPAETLQALQDADAAGREARRVARATPKTHR